MKENHKNQIIISFIIIIIVISSAGLINCFIQIKNNQLKPNRGCRGPELISRPFNINESFIENQVITKNNGGWDISIISECKQTRKWTDTTIHIYNLNFAGIDQKSANVSYIFTDKSELLIFSTGKIYLNYNSTKISIDHFNLNNITTTEIESFENVTFALHEMRPDNKDTINFRDTLYIFKDINGDNNDDIPNNIPIYLYKLENNLTYASGSLS